ncbi:MAG: lipid IV(A) 3-deoxy-D-manno-octulosonic acid transferase [Gammaproteobacteria bacterium]
MIRAIYSLLFYLGIPIMLGRLLWRARQSPAYAQRIKERFALFTPPTQTGGIWIHAVSVGEFIAALPLIKQIQQHYTHLPITITTTTPTGSQRVTEQLGESVFHVYYPYDTPDTVARFLTKIKPSLAIFIETELWPNLFHALRQRRIPLFIANARLSARSMRGYQKLSKLTYDMLQNITLLAAQTEADANRFIHLGLNKSCIRITGSIKFDMHIPERLSEQAQQLHANENTNRPVFIAASTHQGEDEIILTAFKKIRQYYSQLLLILVPRHPERFDTVASLCAQHGYQLSRRSHQQTITAQTDIFLGDTMGELLLFYACADIAFVGGSLVKTGGHNILEPAALGIPSITGPHMFNFTRIQYLMQQANATFVINNAEELTAQVKTLLDDPALRKTAGTRGKEVFLENRGALQRQLQLVQLLLDEQPRHIDTQHKYSLHT